MLSASCAISGIPFQGEDECRLGTVAHCNRMGFSQKEQSSLGQAVQPVERKEFQGGTRGLRLTVCTCGLRLAVGTASSQGSHTGKRSGKDRG